MSAKSHTLRRWLWSQANDLGSNERDTSDRPDSSAYWHTVRLRHLPSSDCPGTQFYLAPGLPFPHWLHRFPNFGDWWREYSRHAQTLQECVQFGVVGRWIRRRGQKLATDDLGTHVAFRILPSYFDFPPPRDFKQKIMYPILQVQGGDTLCGSNLVCEDDGGPAANAKLPRTNGFPSEHLRSIHLRSTLHLVRILPYRLHRHLPFQPVERRPRLRRQTRWRLSGPVCFVPIFYSCSVSDR